MKLIGFVGPKRSGKSVSASILAKNGYSRINFKDALLKEVKMNFPDLVKHWAQESGLTVDDVLEKKPYEAVRLLLQNYGTDFRRRENNDCWVVKWAQTVLRADREQVVADDVRFENEAEMVREMGGILVRVNRAGLEKKDQHVSETESEKIVCDFEVDNNGTFADLEQALKKLKLF